MRELRFSHSQRSAVAQPPPPNPSRNGIQINWVETVPKTIDVRDDHIEAAMEVCDINPANAGPDCRQESNALLALDAATIFVSRPERRAT
jgi:hypothetical protein